MNKRAYLTYTRNFIFGAEDSLVSTVGLLTGVAVGGLSRSEIILTGFTLIIVEAFSMGIGSYLSESTTEESYLKPTIAFKESLTASIVMFISYILVGLIPLLPFTLSNNNNTSIIISITITLIALFILGIISSKLLNLRLLRTSIRMAVLGGIAISIGLAVGQLFGKF